MLSVIYAECHKQAHDAECYNAEFRYAECRYAECRSAEKTDLLHLLSSRSSRLTRWTKARRCPEQTAAKVIKLFWVVIQQ